MNQLHVGGTAAPVQCLPYCTAFHSKHWCCVEENIAILLTGSLRKKPEVHKQACLSFDSRFIENRCLPLLSRSTSCTKQLLKYS